MEYKTDKAPQSVCISEAKQIINRYTNKFESSTSDKNYEESRVISCQAQDRSGGSRGGKQGPVGGRVTGSGGRPRQFSRGLWLPKQMPFWNKTLLLWSLDSPLKSCWNLDSSLYTQWTDINIFSTQWIILKVGYRTVQKGKRKTHIATFSNQTERKRFLIPLRRGKRLGK